jgi:hypothetical protein
LTVADLAKRSLAGSSKDVGARVSAACQRYRPVVKVSDARRWRDGSRRLRLRFARDISSTVAWCLLAHRRGGDVAFASFGR